MHINRLRTRFCLNCVHKSVSLLPSIIEDYVLRLLFQINTYYAIMVLAKPGQRIITDSNGEWIEYRKKKAARECVCVCMAHTTTHRQYANAHDSRFYIERTTESPRGSIILYPVCFGYANMMRTYVFICNAID